MNIEDFAENFKQEILSFCDQDGSEHFREDKFTEVMIDYLVEANEVDDGEVCFHKNNQSGEKLNGFKLSADGDCLDLFVSCYRLSIKNQSRRQRGLYHFVHCHIFQWFYIF